HVTRLRPTSRRSASSGSALLTRRGHETHDSRLTTHDGHGYSRRSPWLFGRLIVMSSNPLPDAAAVQAQIAAFEAELATAKSAREAQAGRDRYLGRRHQVVDSGM